MKKLKGAKKAAGKHRKSRSLILQLLGASFFLLLSGCGVVDLPPTATSVSGNNSISNQAMQATDVAIIVPSVVTPSPSPTFTAAPVTNLPTVTSLPPTNTPIPPTDTLAPPSATPVPPTTTPPLPTNTLPIPTLPIKATATPPKRTATPSLVPAKTAAFFENINDPVGLLQSYYNAINRKEYERAYSYWESAGTSATSTPPAYFQFVQGYANTASVTLTTGMIDRSGAAGSIFVNVPVVLTATNNDRTRQTFYGCYTVRHFSESIIAGATWHIFNAQIKNAPANAGVNSLLAQGCKSS